MAAPSAAPLSTRLRSPGPSTSVWMPRPRLWVRRESASSASEPTPASRVAPLGTSSSSKPATCSASGECSAWRPDPGGSGGTVTRAVKSFTVKASPSTWGCFSSTRAQAWPPGFRLATRLSLWAMVEPGLSVPSASGAAVIITARSGAQRARKLVRPWKVSGRYSMRPSLSRSCTIGETKTVSSLRPGLAAAAMAPGPGEPMITVTSSRSRRSARVSRKTVGSGIPRPIRWPLFTVATRSSIVAVMALRVCVRLRRSAPAPYPVRRCP